MFRQLFNLTKQAPIIGRFSNLTSTTSFTQSFCSSVSSPKVQAKPSKILNEIKKHVSQKDTGRLFAIVHLCGKQFKVTDGDIVIVDGYWPPTIGDKIRIDKVLLAGSRDFTLIGSPILKPGLIDVQATVIEKTFSHTKTNFRKKKQKQFMRINFVRKQHTMLRINSIQLKGQMSELDKASPIERVF
uniref:Large ribosomal subunit protein bL21m n=1 Tax=Culicoides sonorensis TaxID=179676 RepID=A0A336L989_CULSO